MRFLANENFPDPSIVLLRQEGHDVRSIRAEHPGIPDHHVIAMAQVALRQSRHLLHTLRPMPQALADSYRLVVRYGDGAPRTAPSSPSTRTTAS